MGTMDDLKALNARTLALLRELKDLDARGMRGSPEWKRAENEFRLVTAEFRRLGGVSTTDAALTWKEAEKRWNLVTWFIIGAALVTALQMDKKRGVGFYAKGG